MPNDYSSVLTERRHETKPGSPDAGNESYEAEKAADVLSSIAHLISADVSREKKKRNNSNNDNNVVICNKRETQKMPDERVSDDKLQSEVMGNNASLLLREEEIAQIQEETGFTPKQIERLYSRFTSLDRGESGTLSREDFLRIPELAINPLGDRIVHAFFEEGCSDRVNFLQFMQVLAHFRPIKKNKDNKLNSREQKLRFAFKMYDLDNDDKISRDELLAILHMMVGANISEEQLTSIAERTILEADKNCDQMISFEEFCRALERTDVEQKMSIRFLN